MTTNDAPFEGIGDSTSHRSCYIFTPTVADGDHARHHSSKYRNGPSDFLTPVAGDFTHDSCGFRPLLGGAERDDLVQLRLSTFTALWSEQEGRIREILATVNAGTISTVADFVQRATPAKYGDRIPTGLILAGPSISSHGALFQQLASSIAAEKEAVMVVLRSTDASSLKTILKILIRRATVQTDCWQGEDDLVVEEKESKYLNYDLEILQNYRKKHLLSKVVVGVQDSEAFDGALLAELIALLKLWLDRIPFVLLFGIATSTEIFHEKLPTSAIRCMQGEKFDVDCAEQSLERVFDDCVGLSSTLRLGPSLSAILLDRQKEHVQNVQSFVSSLKYAYMSHFYANPLSVLLTPDENLLQGLQPEHLEAIRHLPSFRKYIERTLENEDSQAVRVLLRDDASLLEAVINYRHVYQDAISGLLNAIDLLWRARTFVSSNLSLSRSALYIQAVAGDLRNSSLIRELTLSMRRMPAERLSNLASSLAASCLDDELRTKLQRIETDLTTLLNDCERNGLSLRNEYDRRHEEIQTTVVAQKVQIRKQTNATLPKQDTKFLEITHGLQKTLQAYFNEYLSNPQDLFLSEVYFYDLRSPHRDVFTPRPRHAIERALSSPHDYLACSCCGTSADGLSSTQPATAIVYQLYLESGALINVFDLWSAFYAIVGNEDDEDRNESKALALFYRALADLKFLGLVKHSKKKLDHIAKLAWKGL